MIQGLVSVIMPSFNTGRFIAESIESVLAQSYANWELIIVDDCSTDNTDEVVAQFKDPRIRYYKNEKNSGAAVSRNRALREANGEWIAFLDSDDLWMPGKLECQLAFMQENGYKFSGTSRIEIDEDGVPNGVLTKSPHHVGKFGMMLYCWPGCLTVMYHAPTVGLVQIADLKKNNDYAIWLKVVKKCEFYYFDEILAKYRVRKKSISHDSFSKLLKSHYDLFRVGENKSVFVSFFCMCLNMVFGCIKKLFYKKSEYV